MNIHPPGFSKGGAFSTPAQSGTFNHNHAASMAHVAAGRRAIASALGSSHSLTPPPGSMVPPAPPGGGLQPGQAPPLPTLPGMGATPPGMAPGPGTGMGAPGMPGAATPALKERMKGNFKALIAHQLQTHMGIGVTHDAVKSAIDRLVTKGAFTNDQGDALKKHNGPLVMPQGVHTMTSIANEITKPSAPVTQ